MADQPRNRPYATSGVSQRGRPRGGRSAPSTMMRFVDTMMSPFVQCWQPPIDPCGSCVSFAPQHPVTPRQPMPMVDVNAPSHTDVLCGRGGSSNRHNVHFRELVAANKATYATLTKKQKMLFSRKVVDQVHQAGGRFLAKDQTTGQWVDVGLQRSVEKASQTLREKTSNGSVSIIDEGSGQYEAVADLDSKPNPRTVEAPPLFIPPHLQHIYRPQSALVTPTDNPGWVAEFPPTYVDPSLAHHHHHLHPSDRFHTLPAPHMGAMPFTPRQRSRLDRQQATMVSPQQYQQHLAWQQSFSSATSCNSAASSATYSSPEFHQYYPDFEPPSFSKRHPREIKRQRTKEEEKREELEEQEEVILVDSEHENTLNNSLQEGSEQLPNDVESKLCLQEKVVRSPSELLQSRTTGRRGGEQYYRHETSTTTTYSSKPSRLNTSAEAEGLAGLAALSTAAFLRMDEGE